MIDMILVMPKAGTQSGYWGHFGEPCSAEIVTPSVKYH